MINSSVINAIDYSVMRIGAGGLECASHGTNLYGRFLDWKCAIPQSTFVNIALIVIPLILVGVTLYGFWDIARPKQYPTEQKETEESK